MYVVRVFFSSTRIDYYGGKREESVGSKIRWKPTTSGVTEPYVCAIKLKACTEKKDDRCVHGLFRSPRWVKTATKFAGKKKKSDKQRKL